MSEDVWYISATSQKGFTSDPEMAVKDLTGAAVLCPGNVRRLLDSQDKKYQRSLDVQRKEIRQVWDALLDKMEVLLEAEESHDLQYSTDLDGQIEGITIALAILEYGHDYEQDPDATLERVAEMARVRYDQEAE
jgi:hypothetical protein